MDIRIKWTLMVFMLAITAVMIGSELRRARETYRYSVKHWRVSFWLTIAYLVAVVVILVDYAGYLLS